MSFIFIDRRKAGRGKSSPNRQKLIRRIKNFIKISLPQNIGQGGVSGAKAKNASPVKVAGAALEEPWFCYSNTGDHVMVIIGNDQYDRGDHIEFDSEDESQGGAGPGESGEDDFIVNVARDEFLDLFFEDCELPNLTNEKYTDTLDNKFQQAGFSTSGNPAQLSIIRTYKQALGRRRALSGPILQEIEEKKKELEELIAKQKEWTEVDQSPDTMNTAAASLSMQIEILEAELDALYRKLTIIEGFDKSDLRYRKREAKPLKTVDAVLVMIMDISGSMDENKKTIARRWFALLYAFIKRRYANTELVFIAHHDEAFEMSEDDFFSTKINGGTSVSPAIALANKIIKERYDPNQTNIYVSHASDGDNWESDNTNVINELVGPGGLCNKIQFFSYVEVGRPAYSMNYGSNLWDTYDDARDQLPSKKLTMAIIEDADSCYPVFKKVFKKVK